jgi:hypothetical protein
MIRWMGDRSMYLERKAAFESLRYEEDPRLLIRELVELAAGVAGVPVTAVPEEL